MQYYGIKSALKSLLQTTKVTVTTKLVEPYLPYYLQIILKSKSGSRDIYSCITENTPINTGQIRWNRIFNIQKDDWKYIYEMPFYVTKCSKLQWFQYRINHKILATNQYLTKIKILNNSACTFCGKDDETIEHLLWDCEKVQWFLNRVKQRFSVVDIYLLFSKQEFLFGLQYYKKIQLSSSYYSKLNIMFILQDV